MTLEATIAENTAAIRDLISTIKAGIPTTAAQVAAVVAEAAPATPKAEKQAEKSPPPVAEKQPEAKAPEAVPAPSLVEQAASLAREVAQNKGREALLALLNTAKAPRVTSIPEDQLPAFVAAARKALSA